MSRCLLARIDQQLLLCDVHEAGPARTTARPRADTSTLERRVRSCLLVSVVRVCGLQVVEQSVLDSRIVPYELGGFPVHLLEHRTQNGAQLRRYVIGDLDLGRREQLVPYRAAITDKDSPLRTLWTFALLDFFCVCAT